MSTEQVEIKAGQLWEAKPSARPRRAATRISVLSVEHELGKVRQVQVEYWFPLGKQQTRTRWIKPDTLRKRYVLVAEQETLT